MNLFSTIASVVTTSVPLSDTEISLLVSVFPLLVLLGGGGSRNWFLVILISLILILLLLWLLFLRRLLYNRFTRSWRRIGSVSVLTYVPHFVLMEKQEYFYKKDFCKISYYIIRDMDRVSENLSFFGFGSAVLWHSGPQNSKKSRPKKLVKTNKSIKRFFVKLHFWQF